MFAHPHVFLQNQATFVFDDQGLAGIKIQWEFDDITGSGMIFDYDTNRNGKLDLEERQILKRESFDSLKEFEYYSHIFIEGKEFKVRYVKDFDVFQKDGKLLYSFFIPCHVRIGINPKELRFAFYDTTYYTQMATTQEHLLFQEVNAFQYSLKMEVNKEKSYYYGQLFPIEIILKISRKVL